MTPEQILELIESRCVDDGDCWIWQGCVQHCGTTPTMRHPETGKPTGVRRIVAQCCATKPLDLTGKLVSNTCESPKCVAPGHIKVMTRKQLQERTGKTMPLPSRMKRTAITAQRMRAKSSLDWDKVAEIRASDEPMRALAKRYGVTLGTIWKIKRGITWIERSTSANPFAQLLAA
jgi:hypothetical protein